MFTSFLSVLFPEHCIGCKKPGSALCMKCLAVIPPADTIEEPHIHALYTYNHPIVQRAIWEMKYHSHARAAYILTAHGVSSIVEALSDTMQSLNKESLVLVPIPQHDSRRSVRDFNQSAVLAGWIARLLPETTLSPVLAKIRKTQAQARMPSRHARLANVRHSMQSTSRALDPRTVYVLIDDVTTTGATFAEAKRALKASGAKKIVCIALAHGYASPKK